MFVLRIRVRGLRFARRGWRCEDVEGPGFVLNPFKVSVAGAVMSGGSVRIADSR